ncbi:MAG: DUF5615 family PIN-like protein [Candidatus Eremiobacteraeota bacterium]|nr:DUF5615 family PIN-like protein [Candidatus Eremiobacteraeota bacterium]MCL5054650.1 DUF5615 family PIN-like protein [Bacillota bacterium]
MIFWLDAQLPPKLAKWIKERFNLECVPIRELNLLHAKDSTIFELAKKSGAIVITKDKDFKEILLSRGSPPQVLWLTCGNTSTYRLKEIFENNLLRAAELFRSGEPLVEITELRSFGRRKS